MSYDSIKKVQENLKERRKKEKRVCSFKGFGKKKPHICECTKEEREKCKNSYDKIKKEQYVDSKGQHCFTEG